MYIKASALQIKFIIILLLLQAEEQPQDQEQPPVQVLRRSLRDRRMPERYNDYVMDPWHK